MGSAYLASNELKHTPYPETLSDRIAYLQNRNTIAVKLQSALAA